MTRDPTLTEEKPIATLLGIVEKVIKPRAIPETLKRPRSSWSEQTIAIVKFASITP
jgi:hypothetical protein